MDAGDAVMQRLMDRVREAHGTKAALDIRGGGTKSFYGNAPRGDALDVRELSGVTGYEPTELVVTVLAGTPLADLESVLADAGQYLPFEPPRFAGGGTVGGMVAAGLAGPGRASVGPVRDFVLGMSMLNGTGEVLTFGGQVMKNVAGYDVSRVMAGSMGILGVLCEVSLRVTPIPPAFTTLCFEMEQGDALRQLNRWAGQAYPLNASCWYRGRMSVRLAGAKAAVNGAISTLGGSAMTADAAASWWPSIRDHRHAFFTLSAAQLASGACLWRLCVPDTAPPVSLPGDQFIEWGGALRWLRSEAPAAQVRAAAAALGGHAVLFRATDKSAGAFAAPLPASMAIHRRLKRSFDPAGIFNRGRLYAEL